MSDVKVPKSMPAEHVVWAFRYGVASALMTRKVYGPIRRISGSSIDDLIAYLSREQETELSPAGRVYTPREMVAVIRAALRDAAVSFESATAVPAVVDAVLSALPSPTLPTVEQIVEVVADRLGEHEAARNVFDITDEATTVINESVNEIAEWVAPSVRALLGSGVSLPLRPPTKNPEVPIMTEHRIRVTLDARDGLSAVPVCVGHDMEGCGVRDAFFWDWAASMEGYHGSPLVLADIPIHLIEISEDNGFLWEQALSESSDSQKQGL